MERTGSKKNIFGGIVNYFNKPKQTVPPTDAAPADRGPSKLQTHMERINAEEEMRREQSEHPALRIRSGAGYEGGSSTAGFGVEASGGSGSGWQSANMREFDNQLNSNLGKTIRWLRIYAMLTLPILPLKMPNSIKAED